MADSPAPERRRQKGAGRGVVKFQQDMLKSAQGGLNLSNGEARKERALVKLVYCTVAARCSMQEGKGSGGCRNLAGRERSSETGSHSTAEVRQDEGNEELRPPWRARGPHPIGGAAVLQLRPPATKGGSRSRRDRACVWHRAVSCIFCPAR